MHREVVCAKKDRIGGFKRPMKDYVIKNSEVLLESLP